MTMMKMMRRAQGRDWKKLLGRDWSTSIVLDKHDHLERIVATEAVCLNTGWRGKLWYRDCCSSARSWSTLFGSALFFDSFVLGVGLAVIIDWRNSQANGSCSWSPCAGPSGWMRWWGRVWRGPRWRRTNFHGLNMTERGGISQTGNFNLEGHGKPVEAFFFFRFSIICRQTHLDRAYLVLSDLCRKKLNPIQWLRRSYGYTMGI